MSGSGAVNTVRTEILAGDDLTRHLTALGALRIAIFRDFPYLYDGDAAYEAAYLSAYAQSPHAIVIGAFDGDRLVGAATAAPMEDHAADFAAPFAARGIDPHSIYYFGESVLLPQYRGAGIGHRFFDLREAQARALDRPMAAFCAVIRPDDHPARPAGYTPLDAFWRKRGYAPLDGVIAHINWSELGAGGVETAQPLQFWAKTL